MQTCITKIFLLPALIAGLNLIPAGRVTAQTFTVLHSFRPTGPYTNSDGTAPEAVLVLSGDMLYGTASEGGSTGSGTVFAINTNGTGFTVLHSFTALDEYTNIDGSRPNAGVIRSGNTLYGTAYYGGSSGNGTVFAVNTDGTGFTVLRSFTATSNSYPYGNSDGAAPSADLIVTNNTLYGTTRFGGASGNGTLFRVNTDGTGFTNLYGFTATTNGTNSDGASPEAGLILSGNTLYGTASGGGGSGNGTVFAVNINGTGFTNLHSFTAVAAYPNNTNSDGTSPFARLVLAGNTLYGTASSGGGSGVGTVFAVNTDGTGFTNLHDLDSSSASDGAFPYAGLVFSGGALYGATYSGGSSDNGTVFKLNTNGTGFTNLYSFPYSDGNSYPYAGLVLSGGMLYGTAYSGGSSGNGTVFALNTDGTGFTTLHSFTPTSPYAPSDGDYPNRLVLSGNILYGTLGQGGLSYYGTVFKVNSDGSGFTNLHTFNYSDGAFPDGTLILTNDTLYGTTHGDGSGTFGTVFALHTDGSGFTNLHVFHGFDGQGPNGLVLSGNTVYGATFFGSTSGVGNIYALHTDSTGFTNLHSFTAPVNVTNRDGVYPSAGLLLSGNMLYGTAENGGSSGNGTVFALCTDGTGFTNLHNFTAVLPYPALSTNSDGLYPVAVLVVSGSTLYGAAWGGGSSGNGTVFALNTNGTAFTNLHSFAAEDAGNSEGTHPAGVLLLSDNTLYGTAEEGGSSQNGTVFAIHTDGAGFTNLHNFTSREGSAPSSGLILSGSTLYGTADYGGYGNGTLFSLSFPGPQLTITPSGPNVVLKWPTDVAGFDYTGYILQSTTNLVSPAGWNNNSPAPVVINGQNTVSNPISGAQQFYRLIQ